MYRLAFLFLFISFPVFSFPTDDVTFGITSAIVKVHVVDKIGNHGVGSGIVVAENQVATNCHVVANAQGVQIGKFG